MEFLESLWWRMTSSEVYAPQTKCLTVIILQARKELILHSRRVLYNNLKDIFILLFFLTVLYKSFFTLEISLYFDVKTQKIEECLWKALNPVFLHSVRILTCRLVSQRKNAAFVFSYLCFYWKQLHLLYFIKTRPSGRSDQMHGVPQGKQMKECIVCESW